MRWIAFIIIMALPALAGNLEVARLEAERLLTESKVEEAEQTLRKAVDAERRAGGKDPLLAVALNELGALNQDLGRYLDAERFYKESIARGDPPLPGWSTGVPLTNLASLMMACGRAKDSLELALKGSRRFIESFGGGSPQVGRAHNTIAHALAQLGRLEEADAVVRVAISILKKHPKGENLGVSYYIQGEVAWLRSEEAKAEELLRTANAVWAETIPADHPTAITGTASLGALLARREPQESERLIRRALELSESRLGKQHLFTGTILMLYADRLELEGRKREAKAAKRRGEAILSVHSRENLLHHTIDINAFRAKKFK